MASIVLQYQQNNDNHFQRQNENDSLLHIYVKFAYQTTNATYILSKNLDLSEMIRQLRENILHDFGKESSEYELVETGQSMPLGIPTEEAPAFIIEPLSIRRRFNDQNSIAFYIRLFPTTTTTTTTNSCLGSALLLLSLNHHSEPRCMVCQETPTMLTTLTTYFGCSHRICDTCCAGCVQAGITRCAICRHPR
jgi:hypothetical protein